MEEQLNQIQQTSKEVDTNKKPEVPSELFKRLKDANIQLPQTKFLLGIESIHYLLSQEKPDFNAFFSTQLSSSQLPEYGTSLNKLHKAYNIPVVYTAAETTDPNNPNQVGNDRLQGIWTRTKEQIGTSLLMYIGLKLKGHNSSGVFIEKRNQGIQIIQNFFEQKENKRELLNLTGDVLNVAETSPVKKLLSTYRRNLKKPNIDIGKAGYNEFREIIMDKIETDLDYSKAANIFLHAYLG